MIQDFNPVQCISSSNRDDDKQLKNQCSSSSASLVMSEEIPSAETVCFNLILMKIILQPEQGLQASCWSLLRFEMTIKNTMKRMHLDDDGGVEKYGVIIIRYSNYAIHPCFNVFHPPTCCRWIWK